MCFSAEASFAASAVLAVTGVLALKKTLSPAERLFAAIPLIFAAQQFTEGCVWLALSNPRYAAWENEAVHAFLLVAEVVWPVWAPLALLLLERGQARRKVLGTLLAMGVAVSLVFAYQLAFFPVLAQVTAHHVHYAQDFPWARFWFSGILYLLPTGAPFFVSSIRSMRILGVLLLASYGVTLLWYQEHVTSVWCFFAAIMSMGVLLILRELHADSTEAKAVGLDHP